MLRSTLIITTLVSVIAVPAIASAQAQRNARELRQDVHQINIDNKQLERDQSEVKIFEKLLADISAVDAKDMKAYERLSGQLRAAMVREHGQAKAKLTQAGREVRQDRRELRGERQEAAVTASAHDKVQRVDDRRDLRDDRVDRVAAAARVDRMESLIEKSKALDAALAKGHEEALLKNRRIMGEFLEVMRADLRATVSELGEDHRERREDRRERITDRQESRN